MVKNTTTHECPRAPSTTKESKIRHRFDIFHIVIHSIHHVIYTFLHVHAGREAQII